MTEQIGLGSELTKRTGGVMVAEGAGIATSLGSLLLVKKLAGPERMAAAKEQMAMDVILPILTRLDATLGKFQGMREKMSRGGEEPVDPKKALSEVNEQGIANTPDGTKDAKLEANPYGVDDPTKVLDKASTASGVTPGEAVKNAKEVFEAEQLSPEDKARKYADTLLDMSIMMPVGIVTRILAQGKADRMFGAPEIEPKHYLYAKVPDFVANNVSLVAMNTVAKAPTQAISSTVENILGQVGVPKESAKSMATYLTYVQGSNLIGNMANVGYVAGVSRKNQAAMNPDPPEQSR